MDVLVEGEEMEVLRSVPTSETSSSEQDRSKAILKEMFNGEKTYDNRTEEIHRSRRTTYREGKHRVAGTSNLLGWRPEGICNKGGCLHGGEEDGDVNRAQGCIQMASESGSRTGTCAGTAEQSRKY